MRSDDTKEELEHQKSSNRGFGWSPFASDDDADWSDSSGGDSSSGETKTGAPDQPSEWISSAAITADWVTERLGLNAEISLGLRPIKLAMRLIPRDSSSGLPTIVREISISSKEGAAANQALIQLGKSLSMFKGEREARPQRIPKQKTTPEYYRRMARLANAVADRKEQAEAMKKARENGEQKASSGE
jgi:hypothetical protein